MNPKQHPTRLRRLLAGSLLASLAPGLLAQPTAPAPATPPAPAAENTVTLDEFRVDASQDRGYRATNSISGTRLNTQIRDVAIPIEVLTKTFIQDIGANDVKEALQYSAGVTLETVQGSNNFLFSPSPGSFSAESPTVRIRGFSTRTQLRNGFIVQGIPDSYNVSRAEVVRGPNALLYGVSILGGVVNTLTLTPTERREFTSKVTVGSEEFYRGEFTFSGPAGLVGGKMPLGYAVAGAYQSNGDWTDYRETERKAFNAVFAAKPTSSTEVLLDYEFVDQTVSGNAFQDLSDGTNPNTFNEFGISTNRNIYDESINVARDIFGQGPEFRWSGDDSFTRAKRNNLIVDVTQKIGDRLLVKAGVSYGTEENTQLQASGASVTRNNNSVPVAFRTPQPDGSFKAISYGWNTNPGEVDRLQTRVEAVYKFDLFNANHTFLAGRQDIESKTENNQLAAATTFYKAYNDLTPFNYEGDTYRGFRDQDFEEWNTGHYLVYSGEWFKKRLFPIAGLRWDRYMVRDLNWTYQRIDPNGSATDPANWRRPDQYDDIIGFAANGNPIFNNVGANAGTTANSAPGNVPKKDGYRFGGKVQREVSPTLGLNFRVNDSFSVYALTASGLFPNTGQRQGDATPFEAETTKSKELGIKLDMLEGRVSGTISYFKIDRDNAVFNYPFAPASRNNDTGTNLGLITSNRFQTNLPVSYYVPASYYPQGVLTPEEVTRGGRIVIYDNLPNSPVDRTAIEAAFAARDFSLYNNTNSNNPSENRNSDVPITDTTEGIDFQLNIQLARNWSIVTSYTNLQQEITESFNLTGEDRATEYDVWVMQLGRDNFSDPTDPRTYFGTQAVGVRIIDDPEHAFRLFTNYSFTEGRFRGFSVGGGALYDGERQSVISINNGGNRIARSAPDFDARTTFNLNLGYRKKFGNQNWNFRLNISNLLDDQKIEVFNTSQVYVGANGSVSITERPGDRLVEVPNRARRYFAPRSIRFSASLDF